MLGEVELLVTRTEALPSELRSKEEGPIDVAVHVTQLYHTVSFRGGGQRG